MGSNSVLIPTFITGNAHKAERVNKWLGVALPHEAVDLPEIQGSIDEVVEHKVRAAYEKVGKPVLVEDVGLEFEALGGMPGAYVKWFIEYAGVEALCRILDSYRNKNATAVCVWAYYDGLKLQLIRGEQQGVVSDTPKGKGGFGWDAVFIPAGQALTRAEMSDDMYEQYYTRSKNFEGVATFLRTILDGK